MFLRCNAHFKTVGLKALNKEVGFSCSLFAFKPCVDKLIIPS